MKTKGLRQGFLLLMMTSIIVACSKGDDESSQEEKLPPAVSEAKAWFESQVKDGKLTWKQGAGEKGIALTPDWRGVFSEENADYKVMQIYLNGANQISITTRECSEKYQQTKDRRYLATFIRFVILTNKETNARDGFIMVAYPELPYLTANMDDPFKGLTYLKRPENFCGMVCLYSMDSEFVNGWVYVDGTPYPIENG